MSESVEPAREFSFRFTGGLRWGGGELFSRRAGWPFAHLRANPDQLEIEVTTLFPPRIVLARARVRRIESCWRVLSPGVLIEHDDPTQPAFLHFLSFDGRHVANELGKLGYPTALD